jgi:hypothetical protein
VFVFKEENKNHKIMQITQKGKSKATNIKKKYSFFRIPNK